MPLNAAVATAEEREFENATFALPALPNTPSISPEVHSNPTLFWLYTVGSIQLFV